MTCLPSGVASCTTLSSAATDTAAARRAASAPCRMWRGRLRQCQLDGPLSRNTVPMDCPATFHCHVKGWQYNPFPSSLLRDPCVRATLWEYTHGSGEGPYSLTVHQSQGPFPAIKTSWDYNCTNCPPTTSSRFHSRGNLQDGSMLEQKKMCRASVLRGGVFWAPHLPRCVFLSSAVSIYRGLRLWAPGTRGHCKHPSGFQATSYRPSSSLVISMFLSDSRDTDLGRDQPFSGRRALSYLLSGWC